jgi:hypothetical protein
MMAALNEGHAVLVERVDEPELLIDAAGPASMIVGA